MQPTTQDFVNGVDFTAQQLSGGLLNSGFANLQGNVTNDNQSGITPVIWTIDSALNTPLVPNPASSGPALKWEHYVWYRIPFDTSPGIVYTWNDNVVPDATFFNWVSTAFNDAAIIAQLSALTITANSALNAANTANTNSTNALNQATAAVTVANNASNGVAQAVSDSSAASVAATTANNTANTAIATANAANATAASAVSIAQGSKSIANLNPGLIGQRIRNNQTPAPNTTLEYYNAKDTIVIAQEVYSANHNGVQFQPSNPYTTKPFNSIKSDTGGLSQLIAGNGGIQLLVGVYRYSIEAFCNVISGSGAGSVVMQLLEVNGATQIDVSAVLLTPVPINMNVPVQMDGIITTDGTKVYVVQGQWNGIGGSGAFGGHPANYTVNEIYMTGIFERIG